IYRSALDSLKRFGLSSMEALTRDRLAQLLMKLGRKEEACVEWARALNLEDRDTALARPSQWDDDELETPVMASDWLRALKRTCPGVPLVAFSQLEATAASLEGLVSGAIAKRLDTNARLMNAKEFAEKVRQLIG
ncbi:MAG TPA: hypothetical protein VFS35_07370, partial [Terrimicrobiaceae bacterium]|nr:hypothetical protein [Terrimicrobiaceae bacterium]